jgi:hypothetical protein
VNIIVPFPTEIFVTKVVPPAWAPRPEGQGWNLAGIMELSSNSLAFIWTRNRTYGEAEEGSKKVEKTPPKGTNL